MLTTPEEAILLSSFLISAAFFACMLDDSVAFGGGSGDDSRIPLTPKFMLLSVSCAAFLAIASSIGLSSRRMRSFSSLIRISISDTTSCRRTPFFC